MMTATELSNLHLPLRRAAWTPWEPVVIRAFRGSEDRPHPTAHRERRVEYFVGGVKLASIREVQMRSTGTCQYLLWPSPGADCFAKKFDSFEQAEGFLLDWLQECD